MRKQSEKRGETPIITGECEERRSVIFLCDDQKARSFGYDQFISASGYDELVMVEFERGRIRIKGENLEEVIWLLAEHRLFYLSKMPRGSQRERTGLHVAQIGFIPKEADGSPGTHSEPAIDFTFPVPGRDSSPLVSL